jgi:Leucine-rich repeat (LRR) protein
METTAKSTDRSANPPRKRTWFYPTPGRLLAGLLAFDIFLLVSEQIQWFAFNKVPGSAALMVTAGVGAVMMILLLWFVLALIFRWRFQFSIRSLLVMTVVVAIPCSWMTTIMKQAREMRKTHEHWAKICTMEFDTVKELDALGCRITVKPPPSYWLRVVFGNDLYMNATSVSYHPWANPRDLNLEGLKQFEHLLYLGFYDNQVTDADLAHIEGLDQLKLLSISRNPIADAGFEGLSDELISSIRSRRPITVAGWEHLKGLARLQTLVLDDADITDAGLKNLEGMTQLRCLSLKGTRITDAGLKHLENLDQLQQLFLQKTQITDAGLEHLKGLKQLYTLSLGETQTAGVGLKHLGGLEQLHVLDLKGSKITGPGLECLKELPNLQELNLEETQITDQGMEHLKEVKQLLSLNLSRTQITDAGMEHLGELTHLQVLCLNKIQITDAGLEHLRELTKLGIFYLDGTHITDAGLEHLEAMQGLTHLEITNTKISSAAVAKFEKAFPYHVQVMILIE